MDFQVNEKYEEIFQLCTAQLKSTADLVNKYMEGEEKETELEKLKDIAKEYCEEHFQHKKQQFALRKAENTHDLESERDIMDHYEEILANDDRGCNLTAYDIYNDLCTDSEEVRVLEASHESTDVEQEAVFENLGDSLLCSQVFKPPVDPLTKRPIVDPCRNERCGHVYEHQTIMDFLNVRGVRKSKCPYMGCNNTFMSPRVLVKDEKMKLDIENYNKKSTS